MTGPTCYAGLTACLFDWFACLLLVIVADLLTGINVIAYLNAFDSC